MFLSEIPYGSTGVQEVVPPGVDHRHGEVIHLHERRPCTAHRAASNRRRQSRAELVFGAEGGRRKKVRFRPIAFILNSNSFLLLLVRHLFLVASCYY